MSFILNFLHGVENIGKGAVQLPIQFAENFSNEFANLGNRAAGRPDQTIQQNMGGGAGLNRVLGFSGATGTNRQFAGDVAQVSTQALAPGIAGPATRAVAPALEGASPLVARGVEGAVAGASIGAPLGVEQGAGQGGKQNYVMDFLGGAAMGGITGGVIGTGMGALSQAKPVYAAEHIDDETAAKLAKLGPDDHQQIQDILSKKVGDIVANDTAGAVAKTSDPNIVKNIINNDIANKVQGPVDRTQLTGQQLSTPNAELQPTPTTPTSDINTPAQVNQSEPSQVLNYYDKENNPASPQNFAERGDAAAMGRALNRLNEGDSLPEVVNEYAEARGKPLSQAKLDIDKILHNPKATGFGDLNKGNLNSSLNPQWDKVSLSPVALGNIEGEARMQQGLERATGRRNMIVNEGKRLAQKADAAMQDLSAKDLSIMRLIRNRTPEDVLAENKADNPGAVLKAAQAKKDFYDWEQAVGSKLLGRDIPYRQNYYGGIRLAVPEELANAGTPEEIRKATLNMRPGFGSPQTYRSYEEALANKETPLYANDREEFLNESANRLNAINQLALHSGLEDAFGNDVAPGLANNYKMLNISGGQRISAYPELANYINKRALPDESGKILNGYDIVNANLKNLKLAGGGFHSINILGSYMGKLLASPQTYMHPLQTASDIGDVIKSTFSPKMVASQMEDWGKNGKLLSMDAAHLTHDIQTTEADVKQTGIANKIPVLKQIHASIFGRQIPYIKMQLFANKMDQMGWDRNDPEDLKAMTEYAKSLNNIFGGLDRDVQGLTPKQFKVAARGFLATDYNEGQIRTLLNALSKGGEDGKLARQVVFGKALLFGGLATLGGALGGEFKGQDAKQIAFNILEKMVNPEFQAGSTTIGLPTTQVAELGKPLLQEGQHAVAGENLKTPFEDFASARFAAVPSAAEQLLNNRNFAGNPIYGHDYYGRPVSPLTTLNNVGGMAAPIPITQAGNTITGQQSIGQAIANTVGVRARPTYDLQYAPIQGQTYVQQLQAMGAPKAQVNADTQLFGRMSKAMVGKGKIQTKIESEIAKGNISQAQNDMAAYNQKIISAIKPWLQDPNQNKYLDTTMYQIIQNELFNLGSLMSYTQSDISKNPTKYGLPVTQTNIAPPEVTNNANAKPY